MSDKRDDLPQSRSAAANPAVKRAPQGEASVPSSTRRRASVQPIPLPTAPRRGYGCADVITAIFLLLSILTISLTILLIANPRSPLNPFPPGTSVVIYITTTPLPTYTRTPTATPLPPTVTLIPTSTTTRTITPHADTHQYALVRRSAADAHQGHIHRNTTLYALEIPVHCRQDHLHYEYIPRPLPVSRDRRDGTRSANETAGRSRCICDRGQ